MNKIRKSAAATAVGAALLLGLTLTGCQASGTNADVPKGVPAAVETVSGDVSNKASTGDSNWSYSVEVKDKKAQQEALTKLTDKGFEKTGENEDGDRATYAYTNKKEKINVTVVLTKQDDKFLVIYNINKL